MTRRWQESLLVTASVCVAVVIQPKPFADVLVLTPVWIYMGERIAAAKGNPLQN